MGLDRQIHKSAFENGKSEHPAKPVQTPSSPAAGFEPLLSVAETGAQPRAPASYLSAEIKSMRNARQKGYEGDPCPVCGHLTLVRNGTCLKCDTCGSTTGCS